MAAGEEAIDVAALREARRELIATAAEYEDPTLAGAGNVKISIHICLIVHAMN